MEYTLADAAKVAKVNRSTLFRAVKSGKLSARRLDDKTFRIDASELARVYDLQHVAHDEADAVHHAAQDEVDAAAPRTSSDSGGEVALLRFKLQVLEADLAREREERERERLKGEQERETILENVEDLRKRLDAEQAERRTIQLRLMPPEKLQDRPSGSLDEVTAVKPSRGLLGRLLGR